MAEWQEEYPDFGLSSPTFQALIQTTKATAELCHHLLAAEDNEIEYVLLGLLQQDFLEGRFGWYRQLAGGNYYCRVLQFLQAEKTIRLRNLVNSGYNLRDIDEMFQGVNAKRTEEIKQQGIKFCNLLTDFCFVTPRCEVPVTYYASG